MTSYTRESLYESLLPKALYFVLYLACGCTSAYIQLFYSHTLGFSATQLGYIFALTPFISFVACPLWSAFGDKTRKHKWIMIGCCLMNNGLACLLPLLKPSFGVTIAIVAIGSIFSSCVTTLWDVIVLQRLIRQKELYGKQRLWGAVGVGIAGPMMSAIVSHTISLDIIFYMALGWAIVFCLLVVFLVPNGNVAREETVQLVADDQKPAGPIKVIASQEPYSTRLAKLITPSFALFLVACFMMGIHFNMISSFEYIFLSEYLHASSYLLGFIPPFAVVMELPFFFFAKQILEKLGTKRMLVISQVCAIVRVLLYLVLYASDATPWLVLPLDLLHGTSFAFFWAAAVNFANKVAPKGLEGTAQGLLNGIYGGFGSGIGSFIGGYLYTCGPYVLWTTVAGVVGTGILVFPLTSLLVERQRGIALRSGDLESCEKKEMEQVSSSTDILKTASLPSMGSETALVPVKQEIV